MDTTTRQSLFLSHLSSTGSNEPTDSEDLPIGGHEPTTSECPTAPPSQENRLIQIYLELTPACNSRCPGCLNESFINDFSRRTIKPEYRYPPLSAEKWALLLDVLPLSLEKVILSGGEPTLHAEFEIILKSLEERDLDYAIFTNGRWPNPKRLINILENSAHFSGFLISLHGVDAASHDAFTGMSGSFCETLVNIRRAVASGLSVSLSTVITQENVNINTIDEFPRLALELGVTEISFNRYLYTNHRLAKHPATVQPPSTSQLREAIQLIEGLRTRYAGQLRIGYGPTIPQSFEPSSSRACSAGETSLVVDPWGNVKPCLHTALLCGNLLEQGFGSIWKDENLDMWRDMTTNNGGCRAMALAWGKNQDPLTLL